MENENINNEVKINKQELELLKESRETLFKLRFLVIPDWLYQEDLSGTALKILAFVISYKSDKFYFSTEHLCKMFNVNEIRIKRALKELKENGFIETKTIIKNGGGKIRFIILTEKIKYQKYTSEVSKPTFQKYQKCSFRSIKTDTSEVSKMTHLIKDSNIKDNNIKEYTPLPPKEGEIKNEIETQPQPEPTEPIKQQSQSQNLNDIDKLLEDIKNSYNNILGGLLSECKIFNKQRKSCLKARINENKERANLEWWEKYFNDVKNMPFLLGDNDHGWRADFEWLIRPTNMPKVLEGRYINLGNGKKKLANMIKMSDKEIEEKYAKFDK